MTERWGGFGPPQQPGGEKGVRLCSGGTSRAGCARAAAAAEAGAAAGAAALSTLRGPGGQDSRSVWLAGNGRSVLGSRVEDAEVDGGEVQATWPGQAYPVQWQWDFALIESCG
ncbi:hypothetical protein NW767_002578 [Fusarium falciforme]|nr:hypothetical protein NW767_002578 [Fusarium falciforme]